MSLEKPWLRYGEQEESLTASGTVAKRLIARYTMCSSDTTVSKLVPAYVSELDLFVHVSQTKLETDITTKDRILSRDKVQG